MRADSSDDIVGKLQAVSASAAMDTRDWETAVTRLATHLSAVEVAGLASLLTNSSGDRDLQYSVFFVLHIYYRRMRDMTSLSSLMAAFTLTFNDYPTFPHLNSMYFRQFNSLVETERALAEARLAMDRCPSHAGILNNFAEIVATMGEEEHPIPSDVLDEALTSITRAITLGSGYPKFYATKGRLLALKAEYPDARRLIHQAINGEDPTEFDYALRVGDYQAHMLEVLVRKFSHELGEDIAKAKDDVQGHKTKVDESLVAQQKSVETTLNGAQTSNIQFLGFFAALLSFVVGSTQILSHESSVVAEHLIIVLGGVMLLVLLTFTSVLRSGSERWSKAHWLGALVALTLIIGGLFY
jgi:hypothetical protein